MRSSIAILCVLFCISAVSAQQPARPPDPAFLQKAILSLQAQRNAALDGAAVAEARAAQLAEDNAKLKAQIEELTKPKGEPAK